MPSPNHPNNHDGNLNPNARVPHPADTDTNRAVAYRDGYVHGRVNERDTQYESLEVRDNDNAARGLLIGIALTSLVGLALGALFFFNQRQETTTTETQIVPEAQQTQPERTIIERQVERVPQIIPVPQQSAPQQSAPQQQAPVSQPDVNITVPPAPAPQPGTTQQDTTINVTPTQPDTGTGTGTGTGTAPEAQTTPTTPDAPADTTTPGAGTGAQ